MISVLRAPFLVIFACLVLAAIGRNDWGYQSNAVFFSCILPFVYWVLAVYGRLVKAKYQLNETEFLIILGIMSSYYFGYHCMYDFFGMKEWAVVVGWISPLPSILLCSGAVNFIDIEDS